LQVSEKFDGIQLEDTQNSISNTGEVKRHNAGALSDEALELLQNFNGMTLQDIQRAETNNGDGVRDVPGTSSICIISFDNEVNSCVYNFNKSKNVTPTGVIVIPSLVSTGSANEKKNDLKEILYSNMSISLTTVQMILQSFTIYHMDLTLKKVYHLMML